MMDAKPTNKSNSIIELESVTFCYGARKILDNVSVSVPTGKITAIFGGSGTGKTTFLKLVGGQLTPSHGTVKFDGQSIGGMSYKQLYAARRRMGMLYQFGALFTDLSVFENVIFPLREHTDLPEQILRDLAIMKLDAVGLRGARDLMTSELSGGMARRVALARAIALDPELIMYDEPFTGLDPVATAVIANLISKLNDALGLTSVLVTHDLEVSLNLVDYCIFFASGSVVGHGTPDEIRQSDNPLIKQFINGEIDGPVPLHYPASDYRSDLGLGG